MSYTVDSYTINYDGGLSSNVMLRKLLSGQIPVPPGPPDYAPEGTFMMVAQTGSFPNNKSISFLSKTGVILESFDFDNSISKSALAWTKDAIWVGSFSNDTIYKLDPVSKAVLDSFPVPGSGSAISDLTWDGTHLYSLNQSGAWITKIDPDTGLAISSYSLIGIAPSNGGSIYGISYAPDGFIYAIDPTAGTNKIYKLDSTGSVVATGSQTVFQFGLSYSYYTEEYSDLFWSAGSSFNPIRGAGFDGVQMHSLPKPGSSTWALALYSNF